MPQMAPLWWELLFIMFIMSFMIMNMIIFHNKPLLTKNNNNKNYNMKIMQFKWKW